MQNLKEAVAAGVESGRGRALGMESPSQVLAGKDLGLYYSEQVENPQEMPSREKHGQTWALT